MSGNLIIFDEHKEGDITMLIRQKLLLHITQLTGGKIDRAELVKWAFLIRHETPSRGGESFYDFVPYDDGPFSFSLHQEAEKLVSAGKLNEVDKSTLGLGDSPLPATDADLQDEVKAVVRKFSRNTQYCITDYVAEKYPYFKRHNRIDEPISSLAVYTAGYEAKSVDAFLNGLVKAGIKRLIDVRSNPIARRYGFHRSTLSRLCSYLNIDYRHVPELGIASEMRKSLNSQDDYEALFKIYRRTTLETQILEIRQVADLMHETPSVLVCMEADAQCCHRSHLSKSVSSLTGLPVVHLA
jgi:uncharacterized protein YwgA